MVSPVSETEIPSNILWPRSTETAPPSENAVHIWAAELDDPNLSNGEALSIDEQKRAEQFRFDVHRKRFIAGRSFLRTTLGSYLQTDPTHIEFAYNERGKPSLTGKIFGHTLRFNLAHSENLALLAVAIGREVGVDVEKIRPVRDFDEIAARFFSANETSALRSLPAAQQQTAFFHLWTRKEAWLKATGEGISGLLNQVEVSCEPEETAQILRVPSGFENDWVLVDLLPANSFVGALAVPAKKISIHCWRH
jgi:4'-phosphopantetheinyl transferase